MEAPWKLAIQRLSNKRGKTRQEVTALFRAYLQRDLAEATGRGYTVIGMVVSPRADWPCERAKALEGTYLLHELPDLYPEDCPGEFGCSCILRTSILESDAGPVGDYLRKRRDELKKHSE